MGSDRVQVDGKTSCIRSINRGSRKNKKIHEKLNPLVACHQKLLDQFLSEFWDYYRELLPYRDSPSPQVAEELRAKFCRLFDSDSGYQQWDERKGLTAAKISELLLVERAS